MSEFISFITSEASDRCQHEKRKTINGEDLLWAMGTLGFDDYSGPLKIYLQKYRQAAKKGEGGAAAASDSSANLAGMSSGSSTAASGPPSMALSSPQAGVASDTASMPPGAHTSSGGSLEIPRLAGNMGLASASTTISAPFAEHAVPAAPTSLTVQPTGQPPVAPAVVAATPAAGIGAPVSTLGKRPAPDPTPES